MTSRTESLAVVTAFLALAAGPAHAGDQTWTGDGPFPPGAGARSVDALTLDPATGTVHAGTRSGTVFAFSDAGLSQPPIALDDSAQTDAGQAVVIDVVANDTDPEGALDAASVAVDQAPGNGSATANGDGSVTYAPAAGFGGDDAFTYTVADAAGARSEPADVAVQVGGSGSGGGGDDGVFGVGSLGPLLLLALGLGVTACHGQSRQRPC